MRKDFGRKFCTFTLTFLLTTFVASWAAASEQEGDSSYQPLVLVNTNNGDPDWTAINQGHSRFYNRVRSAGYRVTQLYLENYTDEDLADVDILILPDIGGMGMFHPYGPYALTDEDKEALRRFLRRGGGILIYAYPGVFSDYSNIDSFTGDYGIWFGPTLLHGRIGYIEEECHLAFTRSCKTFTMVVYRAYLNIDPENAVAAVKTVLDEIMVAYSTSSNLGAGRIVVLGNDCAFHNSFLDRQDNSNFGLNVIDYLSGRCDLRVAQCKIKKTGSKRKIQATAMVRNIRISASNAANVTFFLSSSSSYEAGPPEVVASLGSQKIPALNPGEAIEVTRTVKIPKNTAPGDYYVIAVADPEGTSGDIETDNNYRAAVKLVSVR